MASTERSERKGESQNGKEKRGEERREGERTEGEESRSDDEVHGPVWRKYEERVFSG